MRYVLVLIACFALTGCASFLEAMAQQEVQEAASGFVMNAAAGNIPGAAKSGVDLILAAFGLNWWRNQKRKKRNEPV